MVEIKPVHNLYGDFFVAISFWQIVNCKKCVNVVHTFKGEVTPNVSVPSLKQ